MGGTVRTTTHRGDTYGGHIGRPHRGGHIGDTSSIGSAMGIRCSLHFGILVFEGADLDGVVLHLGPRLRDVCDGGWIGRSVVRRWLGCIERKVHRLLRHCSAVGRRDKRLIPDAPTIGYSVPRHHSRPVTRGFETTWKKTII